MHSPSIVLPLSLSLSLSLSLLRDNHLLNEIRKAGKNTRTCARPDFASLCVSRKNCITIRARSLSIRPAASRPPFPSRKRASQERDRREGEREREREVAGGPAASAVRHGEIIRGREDAWFTGDISMWRMLGFVDARGGGNDEVYTVMETDGNSGWIYECGDFIMGSSVGYMMTSLKRYRSKYMRKFAKPSHFFCQKNSKKFF